MTTGNHLRRSAFVALLPYIEQTALSSMIEQQSTWGTIVVDGGGPHPGESLGGQYQPWTMQIPALVCPSEDHEKQSLDIGTTNYGFCVGDNVLDVVYGPTRGMFQANRWRSLSAVTDGTSNTMAMIEMRNGGIVAWFYEKDLNVPALISPRPLPPPEKKIGFFPVWVAPKSYGRGLRWTDGAPAYTAVNSILGPNDISANASSLHDFTNGLYTGGSSHPASTMVLYVDASVHSLDNFIDTGNLAIPAPWGNASVVSPYGVWGELGTVACGEVSAAVLP